jgi:predicted enzyme related to lactoylglutathione lyase
MEENMSLQQSGSYTSLPAEDLSRARDFYKGTLDLNLVLDGSPEMLLFEAGNGSKIFVYPREQTKADHTVLGFVVDDVEQTVEKLKSKGVRFEHYEGTTDDNGIASRDEFKVAWFKDSEGNILCLNSSFGV